MSRVFSSSRRQIIPNERMDPWEHEDGPALEVAVSHHQGHHGIEIMIQSLLGERTCVMIVHGTNKHVTEMIEEIQDDHIDYIGESTGKLVTEARPN